MQPLTPRRLGSARGQSAIENVLMCLLIFTVILTSTRILGQATTSLYVNLGMEAENHASYAVAGLPIVKGFGIIGGPPGGTANHE